MKVNIFEGHKVIKNCSMLALKGDESARSSASAALLEALDFASAFHCFLLLLFLFLCWLIFFFLSNYFSNSFSSNFSLLLVFSFLRFSLLLFLDLFFEFLVFFGLSLNLLFSGVLLNQHAVGSTSASILEALHLTSAVCFHWFRFGSQSLDNLVSSFSSPIEGLSQHPSTSSFVSGKLSSLEFFFEFISGSNSPGEAVVVDSDGVFIVLVESFSSFVLLDYQTFFDFWAVEISLKKFELNT